MKCLFFILIVSLCSCATVPVDSTDKLLISKQEASSSESEDSPPRSKRIYYFQHKLIPNWLYETDGAFFKDAMSGVTEQLKEAAADIVDPEFAAALEINVLDQHNAILFVFEEPQDLPNCYYAIAQSNGSHFFYTTFESTIQLGDIKLGGVVGGWSSDGDHLNMGGRMYTSSEAFVSDVLGN